MAKIIMFAAPAKTGKDTFFNVLKGINNKFERFSFADNLKRELSPIIKSSFNIEIFNPSPEQKELIRGMMIEFGCAHRKIDVNHWVKLALEEIQDCYDLMPNSIFVITDCRFINEYKYLKNIFKDELILVELYRNGTPKMNDNEAANLPEVFEHADFRFQLPNTLNFSELELAGKNFIEILKLS